MKQKKVGHLNFFFYLLRHCRLTSPMVDHHTSHLNTLKTLPIEIQEHWKQSNRKKAILRFSFVRIFLGSLSFLKNPNKSYQKFLYIPKIEWTYLRIYKNGSTSILTTLLPLLYTQLQSIHITNEQVEALAFFALQVKKPTTSGFTFTIVRNPFERIVSAYLDIFNPKHRFGYGTFLFGVFYHSMSFEDLVDALLQIPDLYRGPHFISQERIVTSLFPGQRPTIFKLEEPQLEKCFQDQGLTLLSRNQKPSYDYRSFYTTNIANKVYQLYANDIHALNYEKAYTDLFQFLSVDQAVS